jgi:hypothetical protein
MLRAVSSASTYGCEIPLDSNYEIGYRFAMSSNCYTIAWDTDQDVSDLKSSGGDDAASDDPQLDGHAVVSDIEIIEP